MSAQIIQLFKSRPRDYSAKYANMGMLELLDTMVAFQQERERHGRLLPEMLGPGIALFTRLEEAAETHELRNLTKSYRQHLEHELKKMMLVQG